MSYNRTETFFNKCASKWVKLSFKDKMEWESKGAMEGKVGYELFLRECQKKEKKEDKILSKKEYDKNKTCEECKNKTLFEFGEKLFVCDVCGNVTLI